MMIVKVVAPLLSIIILTVIAALPWGLSSEDRFVLPLLPIVAIHYWSLRQSETIPEWFVFLAGLSLDILTHGPLGFWSLIYLLSYYLGVVSHALGLRGQSARLVLFAVSLLAITAAAWLISSIYVLEFMDWRPFATGAAYAGLGALFIVPLLHIFAPRSERQDYLNFKRGA